jgi:hypothetical protein
MEKNRFTVRITLHDVQDDDDYYETLHTEMHRAGFSSLIKGNSGRVYYLPRAEYSMIGNRTRQQVFDLANEILTAITDGSNITYAILVTGSAGRQWIGLKRVEED